MSHKLFVVGIGPGGADYLTGQARAALAAAQVLCGYTLYVELIAPLYPEKEPDRKSIWSPPQIPCFPERKQR